MSVSSPPSDVSPAAAAAAASDAPPFDPILDPPLLASDKFVIGEIENSEAHDLYKKALSCFWVAESIDMAEDVPNFERLKDSEKNFILTVLAFFAGSDGIVLENLAGRFYHDVQQAEIRLFYGLQMAIENIHSEVYTDLIKAFVKTKEERRKLFQSIDGMNAVQKKAAWAEKWIGSDRPFSERLVAFAAVEGILFSASFCAIFYFRKRGIRLPGLFQSNEYISRDEALHCDFATLIHSQLQPHNQASPETILSIVTSAVETEVAFVKEALKHAILGMNAKLMMQYVKFVADVLLKRLGCEAHYKVVNPFSFMDTISMGNKTNFFERRVTEYSLAGVGPSSSSDKLIESSDSLDTGNISFNSDF